MIRRLVTLDEKVRFHARPAAKVVEAAQQYSSTIFLSSDSDMADAKKVFSIMNFVIPDERKMEIVVDGPDEMEAIMAIETVIKNIEWRN